MLISPHVTHYAHMPFSAHSLWTFLRLTVILASATDNVCRRCRHACNASCTEYNVFDPPSPAYMGQKLCGPAFLNDQRCLKVKGERKMDGVGDHHSEQGGEVA
jgi:hypothetical protein